MIVYIKNKFFSWGGGSTVKASEGKQILKVKGKVFSFTKKKNIYDMNGKKLYMVRNKFWKFIMPSVFIYEQGQKIARLKSVLSFGKKTFTLEGYGEEMEITGKSFFDAGLDVIRNGEKIGNICQKMAIVNDAFILEAEEKDMPFLIAVVIAIDNLKDDYARN